MSEDLITTRVAYLALGSNLGDRERHIVDAIERLDAIAEVEVFATAASIVTPAMYVEGPDFLNTCVGIRTSLEPHALLDVCLQIEESLGRVRTVDKGPRTIDIDIVLFGDVVLDDERLTIPHPGMLERNFVLVPLAEIAPDVVHPLEGAQLSTLARCVEDTPRP